MQRTKPPINISPEPKTTENSDESMEARIVTGMIVDDRICREVCNLLDNKHALKVPPAKKLATWVKEYHDKYGEAPKHEIQGIYTQKLKEGLSEDDAEEIEEILDHLSEDYSRQQQPFNADFLLDQAEQHFYANYCADWAQQIKDAADSYDFTEAEKIRENFQPPSLSKGGLAQHITDADDMRNIKQPKLLIKPWFREGETNIIYALDGVGKSLLAMLIGYILGCKNYEEQECEIIPGEWQVREPAGTLYIDGELGGNDIKENYNAFKWLGDQYEEYKMQRMVRPDIEYQREQTFCLSNKKTQREVIDWLKANPEYKLVIIDSVITLFDLEDENNSSEWTNKVNPFLRQLRAMGVVHIILHHAGKNGDLRGASGIRNTVANVFKLEDHPQKEPGQAWFNVKMEKQRSAGKQTNRFTLRFHKTEDGTEWELTDSGKKKKRGVEEEIRSMLMKGIKQKDIADKVGCTPGRVSQTKKSAMEDGYLNKDGKPTEAGLKLFNAGGGEDD